MASFEVALIQLEIRDSESPSERLRRGLNCLRDLKGIVQLAIFPELWAVGFFGFEDYRSHAEPLNGPTVSALSEAARDAGIWVHGGSFVEQGDAGALYNTSVLLSPQGQVAATYRKIHLFGYRSDEARILTPGTQVSTVQTSFCRMLLSTCYDLRFPEIYLEGAAAEIEVCLVCAAWPDSRLEHWLLLTRARALENLCYVVACNACGINRGTTLLGGSIVVDPWGIPVARATISEEILRATINRDRIVKIRQDFPILEDRRAYLRNWSE